MSRLGDGLSSLFAHAGQLAWLVLSRVAICVVFGTLLNGGLAYWKWDALTTAAQSGNWWSVASLSLLVPLMLLALVGFLVLGYRQGLEAALQYVWRMLGGPLLDVVAERAVGLVKTSTGPIAPRLAQIDAGIDELNRRLPEQRWIVRKAVAMLLARLKLDKLLAAPELWERLRGATDDRAMVGLLRQELDQIELPGLGWWPLALLVVVNVGVVLLLG